jgi:DNA mismatch endonuclease (patch repair protein)
LSGRLPRTRTEYWLPKLARNVERDQQAASALVVRGWSVLTVWECETRDPSALEKTVSNFLTDSH